MTALYDQIGLNYAQLRRPDPRIAAQIAAALGNRQRLLNVVAGAGNYEPTGRQITALEPSAEMIAQRQAQAHAIVQGHAENLPFADDSFDAVMASLTVHHWSDKPRAMAEIKRVCSGPKVFFTFDPAYRDHWLLEYFPGNISLDEGNFPAMSAYEGWFDAVTVQTVPIPHDCTDGFFFAYWRRPHHYLDPKARAAMSSFHKLGDVSTALARLRDDLDTGVWAKRYGHLLTEPSLDCGYRLVIAS